MGRSMQRSAPESMTAPLEITFLGTGTSVGIPVIGCPCPVCHSNDPRNNRLRSSIVVRTPETTLLIDSGPDLRAQALRENLRAIDAVLYTHAHLDHVAGFDELRAFCWHRDSPLPLHATPGCMQTLRTMFGWAFDDDNTYKGYVRPAPHLIEGPFHFGNLRVTPLPVTHATVETVGFLFEYPGAPSAAYIPDAKLIPDSTRALLSGAGVLILDALRPSPHHTHLTLHESLEIIRSLGTPRALLTHLGHENNHATLDASLPPGVSVAYDGLKLVLG